MKIHPLRLGAVCFLLFILRAPATVFYVNVNNPLPAPPFTNWLTAATNIQDAIAVTTNGDTVLVTNGIYGFGGAVMAGDLLNRVALSNAITVQSVNGPWVTTILGAGATNGTTAVRCAWLTNDAALIGFTLMAGATRNSGDINTLLSGGGVWCASSNAVVANCLVVSNTAQDLGGGAYLGTLLNCAINANQSGGGGAGTYYSILNNCTVVNNQGISGVFNGRFTNCIVYYNTPGLNYYYYQNGAFSYCCTYPLPAGGVGNFTNLPQLFADGVHLNTGSPCIGKGTNLVTGTDIDGQPWGDPPSVGCDEWWPGPLIVAQPMTQFLLNENVAVCVEVEGQPPFACTWTKDGLPVQNNGHYSSANTTALAINSASLSDAGSYQVVVSNSFGVVTSAVLQVAVHCVAASGAALPPYSDWTSAATNIQDAIDISQPGDIVLVTNGVYSVGGKVTAGDLTNRVTLDKAILVQSVNGPWVTTIQGGNTNSGAAALRCAWLANGASLIGFTLQGGGTRTSGDYTNLECGGGVWCVSSYAMVANCLIASNSAFSQGAAACQGTLRNCAIYANSAPNGCATFYSYLNSCTVAGNGGSGGTFYGGCTNCIIYYNVNRNDYASVSGALSYCCTYPLPSGGVGNFTNAPQLLADYIHLNTNSPCIGAGTNPVGGTDIDGQPWENPPSIGCDEWRPEPAIISQPAIQFPFNGVAAISVNVEGMTPYACWWTKNGLPVQNDGHYSGADTAALAIDNVNLADAGNYQVVVSNSFGMTTSIVLQVAIHCVAVSGAALPPYSDWTTAATNIQDAINIASPGDIVLVTNGVYAFGGKIMTGDLTNRVAVDRPILVQSANGPWVTTIQGGGFPNGTTASRCAWLTNGASLIGFTLQGGGTRATSGSLTLGTGGGVWCSSSNAIVANCLIFSNSAFYQAGAAYQGTLRNCAIYANNAQSGGATYYSSLNNCTVIGNGALGGTYFGGLTNCIIYYNSNNNEGNYANGALSYCCTYPLPVGGAGNLTNAPQLFVDNVHLFTNSPCIGAGINLGASKDIDGQPWGIPPGIGCSGAPTIPFVGQPTIQLANNPPGLTATAAITGAGALSYWWLKDGTPLQDNGHFSSTQTATLAVSGVMYSDAGNYQLVVSNAFGVVTSVVAQVVIHCVDAAGTNPVAPYLNWATAATNIQDAITASAIGEIVLVNNGLYASGGKSMDGVITNRVSVDKAILVQSVNGASTTVIQGAWDPTPAYGPGSSTYGIGLAAIRCVWMTKNAILSGFTLRGGATRAYPAVGQSNIGGGIWGALTNGVISATIANCIIINNTSGNLGGGAYQVIMNDCTIATNISVRGSGGGAEACNLNNCLLVCNNADGGNGGGAENSNLKNCALVGNVAYDNGSGANGGSLVNCTVTANAAGYSPGSGYGAAVYGATLTNCIVFGNNAVATALTNYSSCTLAYCDADPLPSGSGNIDVNPELLGDGVHLAMTSPCIGAGNASVVSGTDIDGQSWNSPPSIGCDEWQPTPIIGAQPTYQINSPAHGLTFNLVVAGQMPITYAWNKDGTPIQDDGHHSNSGTANLIVNNFGPDDAGLYQVVVSNAFGVVTSQLAQVVIHAVEVGGINPVAPYSTWETAATNIQDAINISAAGDIVLVTNGVYATGGMAITGNPTNRVALYLPITVISVNGYAATVIQGAWDPVSTNGPDAVRCAYLADNAALVGFTLQNGATLATGLVNVGQPSESGGGVCCPLSVNAIVSNCLLTNNSAFSGGGMAYGTLNNSLVIGNYAGYGGGLYYSTANNCTVENNYSLSYYQGAGANGGYIRNSIVVGNYDQPSFASDNYSIFELAPQFSYSCTSPLPTGTGNINSDPQFVDWFHIATTSPCRVAGNASYASGTDLDGELWANPPSMGCDEVIVSNLIGPLSVNILATQTNVVVNHSAGFSGLVTGRAATIGWSFGDGVTITNSERVVVHQWTNAGNYSVSFTAYNNDNPAGVSANMVVNVQPLIVPQIQSPLLLTNGLQFQFAAQTNANYTIQYTPNLVPPVAWQTLQTILNSGGGIISITDPALTNSARFYRILAQ